MKLKLDIELQAKLLNDGRTEDVIELTNEDHSETYGYLCAGNVDANNQIVTAVNCHEELLSALENLLLIDDWTDEFLAPKATIDKAFAAVRKAKGIQ